MAKPLIERKSIHKILQDTDSVLQDFLAVEEPLQLRIEFGKSQERNIRDLSVTMRTPGNDFELVTGFLFSEGIIRSYEEISNIRYCGSTIAESLENIVRVSLREGVEVPFSLLERNFYTNSSCGICGKTSVDDVKHRIPFDTSSPPTLHSDIIYSLVSKINEHQSGFELTGGLHASSLFTMEGEFLFIREDVGRHNALDKLIGYALHKNMLPLENQLLLLSGRIGFELVQKAALAGIKVVVAIGAPSNLAVDLAKEFDMTLIGFLKKNSFNIYCGESRVLLPTNGK